MDLEFDNYIQEKKKKNALNALMLGDFQMCN